MNIFCHSEQSEESQQHRQALHHFTIQDGKINNFSAVPQSEDLREFLQVIK